MKHLLLAVGLTCTASWGQNVQNVDGVVSLSTMIVKDGSYSACGMRFVGVATLVSPPVFPVYAWDFNLTLARASASTLGVILKTEMTNIPSLNHMAKGAGTLKKVGSSWIQAEGKAAWKPYRSGLQGENGLASITTYEPDEILEYMAEVAKGEGAHALLGVQLAGERSTRVYRFKPQMEQQDAAAFLACARSMLAEMNREAPKR